MTFSVLFVCTGNVCRSPIAARIFTARTGGNSSMTVSSAGLRALVGHPIDETSAIALRELGVDSGHHLAGQLDPELAAVADLVLTATSAQRAVVTQQNPQIYRRAFTLLEFGRLARSLDVAPGGPPATDTQLRARVDSIAAQRGHVAAPESGIDDIDDPFGRSLDVARRTAARIADGVDAAIAALGVRVDQPADQSGARSSRSS